MEPRSESPEFAPNVPASEQIDFAGGDPTQREQNMSAQNEAGVSRNEQTERRLGHYVESAAQQNNPGSSTAAMALPVPVQAKSDDDSQSDDTTATPIVAADEDLIEKEWVDKAKQVISSTKNDPYRREQEVKKLQIEYVQKRYNRTIGVPYDAEQGT